MIFLFYFFFLDFYYLFFYVFFCHYYCSANLQIQRYCLYSVSPTLLLYDAQAFSALIFFLVPDKRNAFNRTDNTPCQEPATKIKAFQLAFEVKDLAANGTCYGYLTDLN